MERLTSGQTSYIRYNLKDDTIIPLLPKMTLREAKKMASDIQELVKQTQNASLSVAPTDYQSQSPPWILRKLFGWQTIIKRA
jgi:hypothetical protein